MRPAKPFLVAAGLLCGVVALACGPDFFQLLAHRGAAFDATIDYDFATGARRVASAPAGMKAASAPAASASDAAHRDSESAAAAGASEAQTRQILAMRRAGDGDAAFKLGAGLPEGLRLYTAGAVDFAAGFLPEGEPECGEVDAASCERQVRQRTQALRRAATRFEAVLALAPEAARARAAWAAFSLGRAQRQLKSSEAAVAAFRQVRQRVAQGAADPLLLAAESLGEEARVEAERGQAARAVTLYGEQAALGAPGALNSLQEMAQRLYDHPERIAAAIGDPGVQRLLVAYALAYGEVAGASDALTAASPAGSAPDVPASTAAAAPASSPEMPIAAAPASASEPTSDSMRAPAAVPVAASAAAVAEAPASAAAPARKPAHERPLFVLLDAIADSAKSGASLQDADRLAALAYQGGRYELAQRFAAQAHSPLAAWVQAKLALRRGDQSAAAAHYAEAVRAMAAQPEGGLTRNQRTRLAAENGTLLVARAEFTQALAQWWAVGGRYWLDLAYVAERVVTTDELKAFVDAQVPAGTPVTEGQMDDDLVSHVGDPGGRLRDLLARRLMRDGRMDEARGYFHAADKRWPDPDLRENAGDYQHALHEAERAWTRVGRAQARFEAAALLREHGMSLVGYELAPDGAAVDGGYEMPEVSPDPHDGAGSAERARFLASAPRHAQRFHYRVDAVALAASAADDLPRRSQAFAAVLCRAAGWNGADPSTARDAWRRYVTQGAAVPWATHFGHDCPEPEFRRAEWMVVRHDLRAWRRRHKALAYAGVAAFAIAVAAAVFAWRRRAEAVRPEPGAS